MYVYLPCFPGDVPRNGITLNLRKLYLAFTLTHMNTKGGMLYHIKWGMLYQLLQQQNKLVSLTIGVHRTLGEVDEELVYNGIPTDLISLLSYKKNLQFLKLYGAIRGPSVLNAMKFFPDNLSELTLKQSQLCDNPMPVLGRLPCLMLLKLGFGSYLGTNLQCSAGDFPRLEHLSLEWKFISSDWDVQYGAMPMLATLYINGCFYMDCIPIGLQHLIALKELCLSDIPPKIDKRVVKDEGEDWPIVRHIPSINLRRAW